MVFARRRGRRSASGDSSFPYPRDFLAASGADADGMIGAAHGPYGIEVGKRFPRARITGLDWPRVLEVARENAEHAGLAARYATISGVAFEVELGRGYDVACQAAGRWWRIRELSHRRNMGHICERQEWRAHSDHRVPLSMKPRSP